MGTKFAPKPFHARQMFDSAGFTSILLFNKLSRHFPQSGPAPSPLSSPLPSSPLLRLSFLLSPPLSSAPLPSPPPASLPLGKAGSYG